VGALGGSALGALLGTVVVVACLPILNDGDEDAAAAVMFGAVVVTFVGPPVVSTVLYNGVKKSATRRAGGLTIGPTIAALPPRAPGEAPTLTLGLAASF
jgi:hypothetical protein